MAKFINKKEQVYDFKLTSYGHYLLSAGVFKPVYYAFYDDNVLYDKKYAASGSSENQNNVNARIKNDTQYIESLVLFRDTEETLNSDPDGVLNLYGRENLTYRMTLPAKDVFKINAAIGDARLDAQSDRAPAWKVIALQSRISASTGTDTKNNTQIPQINIDATYVKRAVENVFDYDPLSVRKISNRTSGFADDRVIELKSDDPLYYIEELNTDLLTKNFEIEVYEVLTSSVTDVSEQLSRKYFRTHVPQVQNGFLVSETEITIPVNELTTDSIEYYFDVLLDENVEQEVACKGASVFNKQSYYVDIDFDCDTARAESLFYDIYGSVTEPEICQV